MTRTPSSQLSSILNLQDVLPPVPSQLLFSPSTMLVFRTLPTLLPYVPLEGILIPSASDNRDQAPSDVLVALP